MHLFQDLLVNVLLDQSSLLYSLQIRSYKDSGMFGFLLKKLENKNKISSMRVKSSVPLNCWKISTTEAKRFASSQLSSSSGDI